EALARGRYVVVVDLDANRLYFTRGRRVLWSAPVGTGTGLRLETRSSEWDFSTPNGTFHVTYKAVEPAWLAPDWWFVERGLAVPARDHPSRRFERGLGAAAVYIGQGLAIHGTDKPELLGQRVSHGCIRLANADAIRLFHNVQVGTEVVIVGGRDATPPGPPPRAAASSSSRRAGEPPPRDAFTVEMEGLGTDELLARLDDELFTAATAAGRTRWPQVASVLLFRGVKEEDDDALAGVLFKVEELGAGALRDEYATFLADAYTQGTLRTLSVLGRMERADRAAIARVLVDAAVGLYPGATADAATPWPTKRVLREVLRRDAQRGWDAMQLAEHGYREADGAAGRRAER
ncbi:MAG TPA: L,D-transpeptidase, partial [Longimicrobiaceae bacterium]|nr:L,D-transpeptidase [Longimicrobiaceae bacterium]